MHFIDAENDYQINKVAGQGSQVVGGEFGLKSPGSDRKGRVPSGPVLLQSSRCTLGHGKCLGRGQGYRKPVYSFFSLCVLAWVPLESWSLLC